MKKRILFILFFVSVICLSGCNSNTSLIEGNSDPEPIKSEDQEIQNFLDVEVDSSYDSIIVKMEKDSYSVDSEQIICTVQDNNVGKAFYFYEIPFIEKKLKIIGLDFIIIQTALT